jgi:methyl-accepting chemotaxis protein
MVAFIISSAFVLGIGIVAYTGVLSLKAPLNDLAFQRTPSIYYVGRMIEGEVLLVLAERSLFLATDPKEIDRQKQRGNAWVELITENQKRYDPIPKNPEEARIWKECLPNSEALIDAHNRIMALYTSGRKAEALDVSRTDIRKYYNKSLESLEKIQSLNKKFSEEAAEKSNVHSARLEHAAFWGMLLGTLLSLLFGVLLTRSITKPLQAGVAFAEKLSHGDLTAHIDVDQEDELGLLSRSLNRMAENLRSIIKHMMENSSSLSSAATELSSVSVQLTGNSKEMNEKTASVAVSTAEMSDAISSVSAATEQVSSNENLVAAATEEMTASVSEIAQSADKARRAASEAVDSVNSASGKMNELGTAANGISNVINVIVEIAEQTKLLALNATIEAARAGEAGKGFAVVASEVKDLAKQTGDATEEIRSQIEAMQRTTERSIQEIKDIAQVIRSVEDIIQSIASAVEEQSITSREIASSISDSTQALQGVSSNVAQTAHVARGVSDDVAMVHKASAEIEIASSQVNASAQELEKMGIALQEIVKGFSI